MRDTASYLFAMLIMLLTQPTQVPRYYNETNEWAQRLSDYRSYLLRKNPQATLELKLLFDNWEHIHVSDERNASITVNVLVSAEIYGMSFKSIAKKIEKYMPDSEIGKIITERDVEILTRNDELMNLVHIGLLSPIYPFAINPKTTLLEEIKFYDISDGEVIGEVGAGTGTFSLILNIIKPDNVLYVNDVDWVYLEYISRVLNRSESQFNTDNIHIVKGNKSSTTFQQASMDKIIIRNTYHHFSKKQKMLKSIYESLKPGGRMYILDPIVELDGHVNNCEQALPKNEIINTVIASGFHLEKEVTLSSKVLMEFVK